MFKKQTLSNKIDALLESTFWVFYILVIVLTPVVAVGIFVGGLWTTFVA